MNKLINITFIILVCMIGACDDRGKTTPDFYILNSDLSTGQLPKGFSLKEMNIISYPNSDNLYPDFIITAHINETGAIVGAALSHPMLNNIFIFRKNYDNQNSSQNYFDTLSIISEAPLQPFALDIKPFDVWQIKTNTGETCIILVLETRTEMIGNTPFAEIKFKVKKIIH